MWWREDKVCGRGRGLFSTRRIYLGSICRHRKQHVRMGRQHMGMLQQHMGTHRQRMGRLRQHMGMLQQRMELLTIKHKVI